MIQRPSMRLRSEHGITIFEFHPPKAVFGDADVKAFRKELIEAVDDPAQRKFVVDFSGVEYMSSTVLGVLVSALLKVQKKGGRLRITGVTADLRDLFRLTGMQRVFRFCDDAAEAAASLAEAGA